MTLNEQFYIEDACIGNGSPVFIIAEMSANHSGDLGRAIELVHRAKDAGADAIKLQTYTADTLTMKCEKDAFYIKTGPWKGQYLYDLYEKAAMPWEWHGKLMEEAKKAGIIIFSTPFDHSAVDLLEECDMPAYKIASPEIIDLPLIRRVARTQKPIIMSTGNATLDEINEAVEVAVSQGARDIALLKCTSAYPAPPEQIHLKTIPDMQEKFGCPVGLSDHTLGIAVPLASVAFGVNIIEKHFILDRSHETPDDFFSITPDELRRMVQGIRTVEKAVGRVDYPLESKPAQRSLAVTGKIAPGEMFTRDNIRSIRPGGGLLPKFYDEVIGKKAVRCLEPGDFLSWDMIGD